MYLGVYWVEILKDYFKKILWILQDSVGIL